MAVVCGPWTGLCLLLAWSVLVVIATTDHTIQCKCAGGACSRVTRIDKEECICQINSKANENHNFPYKCRGKNGSVKINTIPWRFNTGKNTTLAVTDSSGNLNCFLVETPLNVSTKARVRCSSNSTINSSALMQGRELYAEPKQKKRSSCKLSPLHFNVSNGWTAEGVYISIEGNSIIVKWKPFFGESDLRIRLENIDSHSSENDLIVPNYQLCADILRSYKFDNVTPGTYIAMVGKLENGAKPSHFTVSDPITIPRGKYFHIQLRPKDTQRAQISQKENQSVKNNENSTESKIALYVIGALAFVATVSFGLILVIIMRRRNRFSGYDSVARLENSAPKLVMSALESDPLSMEIVTELATLTSRPESLTEVVPVQFLAQRSAGNDLRVLFSLQDYRSHTQNMRGNNVITIYADYSSVNDEDEYPFRVHIPTGFNHPLLSQLPNQHRETEQYLALPEILQLVNPELDLEGQGHMDFELRSSRALAEETGNISNIFIVSGVVHEVHSNACMELVRLLEQLGKRVSYALDPKNLKTIRGEGPDHWVQKELRETDLVLIVVSKVLHRLVQLAHQKRPLIANSCLQGCSVKALEELYKGTSQCKVAFVSFGYESEYIDRILGLYPFPCHMEYHLMEETGVCYGESSLGVFLSRLSSDRTLINSVEENSGQLLTYISEMSTIVRNPNWFPETYGSNMSFETLISLPNLSQVPQNEPQDEESFDETTV